LVVVVTAPGSIVKAEDEVIVKLEVERGAPEIVTVWALGKVVTVVVFIVGALNREP